MQTGAWIERLSFLSALHGGLCGIYLHLDDDTPLLELDSNGFVSQDSSFIGRFLQGYKAASLMNKMGFCAGVKGFPDGMSSHRKQLPSPDVSDCSASSEAKLLSRGLGPGRIGSVEILKVPYPPKGLDEDVHHLRAKFFGPSPYLTKAALDGSAEPQAIYLPHIGAFGHSCTLKRCHDYPPVTDRMRNAWALLIDKTAGCRKRTHSSTSLPKSRYRSSDLSSYPNLLRLLNSDH